MAIGGSRTLKLTILGDVDQLKKSLSTANSDVEQSSSGLGDFSKKAGLAFAAAGAAALAYAGKLAIDGVKAAIEDEAAQVRLANALRNTVGATDANIKATEDFILKTSLATGTADDLLRPALERLTRSTKDIEEAQKLTNLALDIAAAKGLDVTTVANALAKANDGQVGALKKLGITLGDNATNLKDYNAEQTKLEKLLLQQIFVLETSGSKSKEYAAITEKVSKSQGILNDLTQAGIDVFGELGKEFEGAASEAANTFEGKLARLKITFDEAKETVGAFILDAITPLIDFIVNKVIPNFGRFTASLSDALAPAINLIVESFNDFFLPTARLVIQFVADIVDKLKQNKEIFELLGIAIGSIVLLIKNVLAPAFLIILKPALVIIGGLIDGLITGFGLVAKVIMGVVDAISVLISLVKNNPLVSGIGNLINNAFGGGKASGGTVVGGTSYLVGEQGAELFTPSQSGTITPNNRLGGNTITINVNGAIDPEGTARTIVDTLNNSFYRGTGGAGALVTI
jgi:hypothetical protein